MADAKLNYLSTGRHAAHMQRLLGPLRGRPIAAAVRHDAAGVYVYGLLLVDPAARHLHEVLHGDVVDTLVELAA